MLNLYNINFYFIGNVVLSSGFYHGNERYFNIRKDLKKFAMICHLNILLRQERIVYSWMTLCLQLEYCECFMLCFVCMVFVDRFTQTAHNIKLVFDDQNKILMYLKTQNNIFSNFTARHNCSVFEFIPFLTKLNDSNIKRKRS